MQPAQAVVAVGLLECFVGSPGFPRQAPTNLSLLSRY